MTRSQEIESIVLTPEEKEKAIYEAKIAKWFRERNAPYWENLEKHKPKDNESKEFSKNKTDAPTAEAIKNVLQKRSKERWGKAHKANKTVQ
jgi:hypothetical protein